MSGSLIEGMEDIGAQKGGGSGGGGNHGKMIKFAILGVIAVVLMVVMAFQWGLIGGETFEKPDQETAEENAQEAERVIQEEEEVILESPNLRQDGAG